MMRNLIILACVMIVTLLSSCGDKNKEFLSKFAEAVKSGNKTEIANMYPDAASFEGISFNYNPETATITEQGDKTMVQCDNVTLTLAKDAEGNLKIESSKGMLTVPEDKLNFAKATGWYDESLTDKENATALADTGFMTYINDKVLSSVKSNLTARCSSSENWDEGISTNKLVIKNNNDFSIPGSAYNIVTKKYYPETGYAGSKTYSGRDLDAHGSTSIKLETGDVEYGPSFEATIELTGNIDLNSIGYTPTGNEYKQYKGTADGDPTSTSSSQSSYECTGNDVFVRTGPGKSYAPIKDYDGSLKLDKGDVVYPERGGVKNGYRNVSGDQDGCTFNGWVSIDYLK